MIRIPSRLLAGVIVCVAGFAGISPCCAQGALFTVPYDGMLYFTPLGGEAGATTEFGFGTSQENTVPVFTGLPANPDPSGEVGFGFYAAGTPLDFYEKTVWNGTIYWAFSVDTTSQASRVAFMDLDNSLGLGGSIVQQTSPDTWTLHLDDAASYLIDDDDDDVLIQITLVPVPEPSSATLLVGGSLLLLAAARRKSEGNA